MKKLLKIAFIAFLAYGIRATLIPAVNGKFFEGSHLIENNSNHAQNVTFEQEDGDTLMKHIPANQSVEFYVPNTAKVTVQRDAAYLRIYYKPQVQPVPSYLAQKPLLVQIYENSKFKLKQRK